MSRSGRIALATSAVAAALVLAGCADATIGLAEPDRMRTVETSAGTPGDVPATDGDAGGGSDNAQRTIVAEVGECLDGDNPGPVECSDEHTVEVTKQGTFGGDLGSTLEGTPPDASTVFRTVFPQCRAAAAEYLGSSSYDASTLGAWLVWADAEDWNAGHRWYRCGVAQLDGAGKPVERTGSIRNALAENFDGYRVCSTTRPSAELPETVPCSEPHLAEAVGVVDTGKAGKAVPTEREFNDKARSACGTKVHEFVGADRRDVAPSWRWPDSTNWRIGFTNITCYAELNQATTGSVRDIGSSQMPN
ncbi:MULTISPECIES: septum formation family protein [Prauserella salsuginis group]|uniref:Septum formation family protein n=1 Tax=Prauserella salsuginis TaxID=387889 RepID=A0ABW6FYP6_9PSEU|nr:MULTISPECIES: septum formation family protein [Prauserella salsuginis group]MCR3720524.1 Septum formation [Prauserella flava]MCR3733766.1 Septum formation [Prauserella salsuginis]